MVCDHLRGSLVSPTELLLRRESALVFAPTLTDANGTIANAPSSPSNHRREPRSARTECLHGLLHKHPGRLCRARRPTAGADEAFTSQEVSRRARHPMEHVQGVCTSRLIAVSTALNARFAAAYIRIRLSCSCFSHLRRHSDAPWLMKANTLTRHRARSRMDCVLRRTTGLNSSL